jgi:hypothetical protein
MPDEQEQEQPRAERTQEELVRELRDSVGAASGQGPTLRDVLQQSFVTKVVQDPLRVPAVWLIPGYLGESSEQDHTRLYLVPNLAYWIEIPTEAILHVAQLQGPANFLGTVLVWVRQGAQLMAGNCWSGTLVR